MKLKLDDVAFRSLMLCWHDGPGVPAHGNIWGGWVLETLPGRTYNEVSLRTGSIAHAFLTQ